MNSQVEIATFGAGCFWGVEARFRAVEGVLDATSGYMGGKPDPDYKAVCTGTTGHAEVVQVRFDPQKVNYGELLALFFDMHNPTTLNRQGPDIGNQYRSVVFFHSADQETAAKQTIAEVDQSGRWQQPVVTRVEPAVTFWPAEEYHQRYLEKNGLGFCSI
ncbi:MAG TPA: peptide-methionine (S)-S-oxide reductase MsrA [Xanthomonadales bacterium]